MGPVVKREDLEQVISQINGRFDWFTKKIEKMEKEVAALKEARPAKETAK